MRKKHNPRKRLQRVAHATLRQDSIAAIFAGGNNGYTHLINHKTGQLITPTGTLVEVITTLGFKWSTLIAVMCKDQFGQHYMRSEQIDIDLPLKQSELAQYLNDMHFDLIKSCNQKHLVNVGWISSPFPTEWDEAEVSELFNKVNGWTEVPIQLIEEEIAA